MHNLSQTPKSVIHRRSAFFRNGSRNFIISPSKHARQTCKISHTNLNRIEFWNIRTRMNKLFNSNAIGVRYCLTPTLSGVGILNDATLIIQNWLFRIQMTNFDYDSRRHLILTMNQIVLEKWIFENFRGVFNDDLNF